MPPKTVLNNCVGLSYLESVLASWPDLLLFLEAIDCLVAGEPKVMPVVSYERLTLVHGWGNRNSGTASRASADPHSAKLVWPMRRRAGASIEAQSDLLVGKVDSSCTDLMCNPVFRLGPEVKR